MAVAPLGSTGHEEQARCSVLCELLTATLRQARKRPAAQLPRLACLQTLLKLMDAVDRELLRRQAKRLGTAPTARCCRFSLTQHLLLCVAQTTVVPDMLCPYCAMPYLLSCIILPCCLAFTCLLCHVACAALQLPPLPSALVWGSMHLSCKHAS